MTGLWRFLRLVKGAIILWFMNNVTVTESSLSASLINIGHGKTLLNIETVTAVQIAPNQPL